MVKRVKCLCGFAMFYSVPQIKFHNREINQAAIHADFTAPISIGWKSKSMFSRRNAALSNEIKQLQKSELDLKQQKGDEHSRDLAAAKLIPATQHILGSYPVLTVEAKNTLWKLVMRKATIYRTPEDELHIHIYPNLPK